jgi:hypothetical protein
VRTCKLRLELLALASPNACQHRRRSEWFQRQAAQGSPSSKPGLLRSTAAQGRGQPSHLHV